MRIVLAPDSFKESMTAREAARAMAEGVKDADPRARTVLAPMSDGGEGFVDAVAAAWGADLVDADTVDALGRPIRAVYGLSGGRAVMDVAGCAGLELIAPADRDVLRSSTAGLGLLMRDALRRGARTILLGIGGSATNDAGVGMLHALGAGLLDADGRPLAPRPDQLDRLAAIDASALAPLLGGATIRVACDVTNPLTGPNGATAVFGPQKGATADLVPRLERALERVAPAGNVRLIDFVVLVGGSSMDFEISPMVTQVLSQYGVVAGRGNIRGTEGPRNAVATGLVLSYLDEAGA